MQLHKKVALKIIKPKHTYAREHAESIYILILMQSPAWNFDFVNINSTILRAKISSIECRHQVCMLVIYRHNGYLTVDSVSIYFWCWK